MEKVSKRTINSFTGIKRGRQLIEEERKRREILVTITLMLGSHFSTQLFLGGKKRKKSDRGGKVEKRENDWGKREESPSSQA